MGCPIPYLDDGGENQLWEPNAVGLAVEILKDQVIELFNESILGRGSRNREIRQELSSSAPRLGNEPLTYRTGSHNALLGQVLFTEKLCFHGCALLAAGFHLLGRLSPAGWRWKASGSPQSL